MASLELLNFEDHGSLQLQQPTVGDRHFIQVVADEFSVAAAHCPLFFAKNPETGRFYTAALFGFHRNENLLAASGDAGASFCPLDIVREGFFVSDDQIAIDPAHPRFHSGETLFDEQGEPGEELRKVQHMLGRFKAGLEETDRFIDTMLEHRLIEPIDIALRFDDGENLSLAGLYSIGLDSLNELDDAAVLALFRKGYLQLAYAMIGSLKRIPVLAAVRNRQLAGQRS